MRTAAPDAEARARRVKLMVLDVDGVLTDGRLWYGPSGEALKAFHSYDGHGIRMLAQAGVRVAILSGRSSAAVSARAAELGIEPVLQGVGEKGPAFAALLERLGVAPEAAGAMGDELVDLPMLRRCGFAATVGEAPEAVRRRAHYVATAPAGAGAVREVCEYILRSQGAMERLVEAYLA